MFCVCLNFVCIGFVLVEIIWIGFWGVIISVWNFYVDLGGVGDFRWRFFNLGYIKWVKLVFKLIEVKVYSCVIRIYLVILKV